MMGNPFILMISTGPSVLLGEFNQLLEPRNITSSTTNFRGK